MEVAVKKYLAEGRLNLLNHNYGKAFAFYLLVLKICPQCKRNVYEDFSASWREWSARLREIGRVDDLFSLYEQGCNVFVECDMLHFHMGNALFQLGLKLESVGMFRKTLVTNENCYDAQINLENACRGLIDSWHFAMINDSKRNKAFDLAIAHSVEPLGTVLDIGSGSGILSMMAVKHGSDKVYACEMSEAMQVIAEECIRVNDMMKQIHLQKCFSAKLSIESDVNDCNVEDKHTLPSRCKLVISETVDAGFFGEGIIDTLHHAWNNLLLPPSVGGCVVPSSASLYCALVECEEIWKKHSLTGQHNLPGIIITSGVGFKQRNGMQACNSGMDKLLSRVINTCDFEPYTSENVKNVPHKILSTEQKVIDINLNDPKEVEAIANNMYGNVSVKHVVKKPGFADAIVLWFDLHLVPNKSDGACSINTAIGSNYCWDQATYPIGAFEFGERKTNFISSRLEVKENETLISEFEVHADCLFLISVKRTESEGFGAELIDCHASLLQRCENMINEKLIHVTAHEEQILRINDTAFNNTYFRATCNQGSWFPDSYTLLDISNGFDLLAVKTAQVSKARVHKYCQTQAIRSALEQISNHCDLDITFYNEIPSGTKIKFDVISLDVIEPSGLLSPNAISNILQVKHSLSFSGAVVPNNITLIAQCISSEELVTRCMVVSDDNTLGFKIADTMNDFRVSVHSDLEISTLNHVALSRPKNVLCYNFNDSDNPAALHMKNSLVVKILTAGTLHAVLFWFKINVHDNDFINTSKPNNHWKQAAYVFSPQKQLLVHAGDDIVLDTTSHNDSIFFCASKCQS